MPPPTIEQLQAEVDRLAKLLNQMANSKAGNDMGRAMDTADNNFRIAKTKFDAASRKAAETLGAWRAAINAQRAALEALLDDPSAGNEAAEVAANKECETALAAKEKATQDLDAADKGLDAAKKAVEAANARDTKFFAMLERLRKLKDEAEAHLTAALKASKDKGAKEVLAKVVKL